MNMEELHVYPEVALSIADGTPSQSGSQYVKLQQLLHVFAVWQYEILLFP